MTFPLTYTIDRLKDLDPTSSLSAHAANGAAAEFTNFIDGQAGIINNYLNLGKVLNLGSETEIKNAAIAIYQITQLFSEVVEHHKPTDETKKQTNLTGLWGVFSALQGPINDKSSQALMKARMLLTWIKTF